MRLSPNEKALLLALPKGRHFKNNPIEAKDLLRMQAADINPAARQLISLELASRVVDTDRPAAITLRLSDSGVSEADKTLTDERKPTVQERVKAIPIGKGFWDIARIAIGAALGVIGTKYFGK